MKRTKNKKKIDSRIRRKTADTDRRRRGNNELLRALSNIGIDPSGVRIKDTVDGGRGARRTDKARRDEIEARGSFSGSRGGFGFVNIGESRDVFIPEGRCGSAIDGDTVDIIYHTYTTSFGEEKTEGRVVRVATPSRDTVVGVLDYERLGRYRRDKKRLVLIPDEARISSVFYVRDAKGALPGDKVAVKLLRRYSGRHECNVIKVLGDPESREANYEAILIEAGIPLEFSPEELDFATRVAASGIDYENRLDLTGKVIFTIDGEGAKDLDDAVSVSKLKDGWELGVHIADVSHYVTEKTPLDRCAMARGTSVYFVDKVVPMLPEVISNGICSLNAGEDKATLTARIKLTPDGEIVSVKLDKSVIRSRVRGVYSEVNKIFSGDADKSLIAKYRTALPALTKMRELYSALLSRAEARGMLGFEIPEPIIMLNSDGYPVDIVKSERGIAERMIEQFMLIANEAVAKALRERGIPCVYRIHEKPPEDKLRDFLSYSKNLGLDIRGIFPESVSPDKLNSLLSEAEERGVGAAISYLLLRSMAKAKYSDTPEGHFGLGLKNYCHFTSPIRRLSDLATHRIIHRVLLEGKSPVGYSSYARRAAVAATECEVRAVNAERRIEDLYKCLYMAEHIGEVFDATVSSCAGFGLFAELDNTVEGLVPLSEMPGYFVFDEKNMSIRSSKLQYRVGDRICVRVAEVELSRGKIRFELLLNK